MAGKTEKTVAIKAGKGRVAGAGCFSCADFLKPLPKVALLAAAEGPDHTHAKTDIVGGVTRMVVGICFCHSRGSGLHAPFLCRAAHDLRMPR